MMELYQEILYAAIMQGEMKVAFSENPEVFVERKCYQALCEIQKILADDHLTDAECFMRIEEIVMAFEEIGSGGKGRHDF